MLAILVLWRGNWRNYVLEIWTPTLTVLMVYSMKLLLSLLQIDLSQCSFVKLNLLVELLYSSYTTWNSRRRKWWRGRGLWLSNCFTTMNFPEKHKIRCVLWKKVAVGNKTISLIFWSINLNLILLFFCNYYLNKTKCKKRIVLFFLKRIRNRLIKYVTISHT